MKSIILATALTLSLTVAALAWTHGAVIVTGFILDNQTPTPVILTNDSGSQNLLAQ